MLIEPLHMLKQIFEHSFEPVLVTDTGVDAPFVITYANPAFCRLTGYELDELVGHSPTMLQGERSNRHTLNQIRCQLARQGHFTGTSFNYRKDGSAFPVQWTISPFNSADGKLIGYFSVQRDMTPMWKLSNQLKQQQAKVRNLINDVSLASNGNALPPAVQDDIIDLGFEDFSSPTPSAAARLVDSIPKDTIPARVFMQTAPIDKTTVDAVMDTIYQIDNNISLMMLSGATTERVNSIANDLQTLGEEFRFLVEFDEISVVLFKLAEHIHACAELPMSEMSIAALHEFIEELSKWFSDIFVQVKADNIHAQTPSIIASAEQFRLFFH